MMVGSGGGSMRVEQDNLVEYKDMIYQLKQSDHDFAVLYDIFVEVDRTISQIERGTEPPSSEYAQTLKQQRILLKDEIYGILKMAYTTWH